MNAAAKLALSPLHLRALVTVWITYGTFYFCRVNIGPARTEIQGDTGINPFEMGLVLGSLKVGYAIAALVNGQLAERFGPKRILLIGMFGSAAMCVLFAFAPELAEAPGVSSALPTLSRAMSGFASLFSAGTTVGPLATLLIILWFTNGVFQSGGWPSTVKVMSNWFSAQQRGRLMGIIGTSYQLGSAATIIGAGYLASGFGWRAAFLVPAGIFFLSALHSAWRLREHPPEKVEGAETRPPKTTVREALWLTLSNGRIWILALALFGLDIVRYGFLDWAPGHLKEAHDTGIGAAALKAAVLPLAGAAGALVSGWATDRFFQSRRAPVIAVMLVATGALTLLYPVVVPLGWVPTVVCLGAIGFFLYGAQILIVGTAAQDFARGRATAAAAGFVDFAGYMGAFAGDIVTGYLIKSYGWHTAIGFWAAGAIVAGVLVSVLWNAKARAKEATAT